jgi:arsenate reductase
MTAHRGIPGPAEVEGAEEEKRRAFADALFVMKRSIALFASLPLEK